MKNKISPELQEQAQRVAKSTQKPGQTKEQTKLIAKGIEKGIADYKKQQNKQLRERDKLQKKEAKLKQVRNAEAESIKENSQTAKPNFLPWILLGLSWIGFVVYLVFLN